MLLIALVGAVVNDVEAQQFASPLSFQQRGEPIRQPVSSLPREVVQIPTSTPPESGDDVVPAAGLLDEPAKATDSAANLAVIQTDIDATTKAITDVTDLDEATKKEALERLKNAIEWLKTAKAAIEKGPSYLTDIDAAPDDLREARRLLALPRQEPQFRLPADTKLAELEKAVTESDERLNLAKETLTKREETLKRRSQRKAELTKLIPETEKACDEAKKALTVARDRTSPVDTARRLEAEAKFAALEQQRTLFPLEAKRIDALADLAPLVRDLGKRDVEFAEKEAAGWQSILTDSRKRDSDRQVAKARQQVQEAEPALRSLAERNSRLAEQRKAIVSLIEATASELQQASESATDVNNGYRKMTERVEKAGNSTTVGFLLRGQREQLPDIRHCRNRLRFVNAETPKIHLALLDLQDEQELLDDRESVIAEVVSQRKASSNQYDEAYFAQAVGELLTTKGELLDKLVKDHEEYIRLLGELEVAQAELIERTQESRAFIDERVLWIRSSDPIGSEHFSQAWAELKELGQPEQWRDLASGIGQRVAQRPAVALLAMLVVGMMLLCRNRFRRRVNRICEVEADELRTSFAPTVEAVAASALATAFWPGLMWLGGWQLRGMHDVSELSAAMGRGLQNAAFAFWLCRFVKQLCRANGIAERHFSWGNVRVARRSLAWLSAVGIPCVFFITAVSSYRDGEWSSFLGRVGFLVGMATLAVFAHSTLRTDNGIFRELCGDASDSSFCRLRHAAYIVGIGIPAALALLAALGYDYSAQHLAMRGQATLTVVLAVILTRSLALRWLEVRSFRLQEAVAFTVASDASVDNTLPPGESGSQARRGPSPAATASDPPANGRVDEDTGVVPSVENERTDSDLRYLLRYAVAAALFVGGYVVWSDVAPALSVLDQFEISSKLVEVKQSIKHDDGTTDVLTSQKEVKTTLKHVVLASLLLGIGLVLARNLPALIDVVLLEHMPIDKGQRYAAGMILRYLLTLTTVVMACLMIGLNWSSIHWLAAAMTVGLGFGLQEIFANLVSGLIILFERPIRVGDLVTVGGISGRVTRMQIRATTITSFDRRELIVPNKKFITEDVINWTLTDDVNRVEIEVGVAYGSPTELTRELLLKVARNHPIVLDEPEPLATFDRFADSSLNFTLRCFLPNLDDRLAVIHELHSEIDRQFRQANIEIAFPQQDLHVRTIDAPLRGHLLREKDHQDAA